jgi:carboxyl-terminal processing protease
MKLKTIRNIVISILVLILVAQVSFNIGKKQNKNEFDLSLMWKVKGELQEKYLDKSKIVNDEMKYGAIEGLVSSLDDPYTVFLPPKENKSANDDLAGKFGGVGISLGYKDKTLAVMSALPKTPAEKAGLVAGDLILKIIDKVKGIDKDTTGITLQEAVELIRGDIGTEITLKMYREGKDGTFDVVLKRDNIEVPSIELEWVERKGKKVAWVKLYKFTDTLFKDWAETVDNINKEKGSNYGGIVLDLRSNPGGYLAASVYVASDFIKSGVIVKQESSKDGIQEYKVDPSRNKLLNDKLVVLVNGGSASAAEILAGALKEYKRGLLVGEKTFGKGTVQEPENFKDGSGIHITIAKWLLPSGKNIHTVGVDPDVEVLQAENQLEKAVEVLLK